MTDRLGSIQAALTDLVGVRVRLGDEWVVVHPDDVELVFGDFGDSATLDEEGQSNG